jgi:hypothetical protein
MICGAIAETQKVLLWVSWQPGQTTILHFSQANHGPWKILAQVVQYLKRQKEDGATEGIMGGMKLGTGGNGVGAGVAKEDLRIRSRSSLNFETMP